MELAYRVWTSCSLLQDELQHRGKSIHGDVGRVGDGGCYVLCWIDGAKSDIPTSAGRLIPFQTTNMYYTKSPD